MNVLILQSYTRLSTEMIPYYDEEAKNEALESPAVSDNSLECYSVKVSKLGTKLMISFPIKKGEDLQSGHVYMQ